MNPSTMLRAFCDAVEQRNGKAFAELFTEDGVYHDVFYGAFAGHAKIAELIEDWFYRTATDFRWDMHTPVNDGHTLYTRYTFSYRSTLPEAEGARAMFEGVAIHAARRQDRGISRGRQYRARFCRYQVRARTHRQNRRQAGCGAEGAAGDEAAFGGVISSPSLRGAQRRSNPVFLREARLDCFASLAMTDREQPTAAARSSSASSAPMPLPSTSRSGPSRHRASIRRSRCPRWRGG